MPIRRPRYSKEEFARRGEAIYESEIRSQLEAENDRKIVAIDIETGAFEVADEPRIAVERLYDRYPDAQPWMRRIGKDSAVHRMLGFRVKRPLIDSNSIDLATQGIDPEQAEILQANLATFAADWNSPEMSIYDDYDAAKANQLPSQ
jgi:hypothetical protein